MHAKGDCSHSNLKNPSQSFMFQNNADRVLPTMESMISSNNIQWLETSYQNIKKPSSDAYIQKCTCQMCSALENAFNCPKKNSNNSGSNKTLNNLSGPEIISKMTQNLNVNESSESYTKAVPKYYFVKPVVENVPQPFPERRNLESKQLTEKEDILNLNLCGSVSLPLNSQNRRTSLRVICDECKQNVFSKNNTISDVGMEKQSISTYGWSNMPTLNNSDNVRCLETLEKFSNDNEPQVDFFEILSFVSSKTREILSNETSPQQHSFDESLPRTFA